MLESKLPYDPTLKLAAKEFEDLCKKYDMMGSAIFASKTHAEFITVINPSWSVAKFEKNADGQAGIRFRSKKDDFPLKEAQQEATESTVHGFTSFLQHAKMMQSQIDQLLNFLRKHMKIMYGVWGKPYTGETPK